MGCLLDGTLKQIFFFCSCWYKRGFVGVNEHKFRVQFLLCSRSLVKGIVRCLLAVSHLAARWSLQLLISYSGGVKGILCNAELRALQFLVTFETNLT